jgi:hypothetical protein
VFEAQQDADNRHICSGNPATGSTTYQGAVFRPKAAELRIVGNNLYAANHNHKLFGTRWQRMPVIPLETLRFVAPVVIRICDAILAFNVH